MASKLSSFYIPVNLIFKNGKKMLPTFYYKIQGGDNKYHIILIKPSGKFRKPPLWWDCGRVRSQFTEYICIVSVYFCTQLNKTGLKAPPEQSNLTWLIVSFDTRVEISNRRFSA